MAVLTDLLQRAEAAGIRFHLDEGDRIVASGPRDDERLIAELREYRGTILAILQGKACSRCAETGERLVGTYWTKWRQALCVACVPRVVAGFELNGWPSVRWEEP